MEPQLAILGALGSLLMGVSLGVFGAGGSILTVPILAFLLGYSPTLASHYSLFIVGVVSAAGVARQWSHGAFRTREAIKFTLPAMAAMFLMKRFFLPSLPAVIWKGDSFSFTLDQLVLAVFAILMILAAGSMMFVNIKDEKRKVSSSFKETILLAGTGILTGGIAGFVGAGGGFLIVPALVFLGKFPIKEASRTSLFVIALNSIWGFIVGTRVWSSIPFLPLFLVVGFALIGMLGGIWMQERVHAARLKPGFGFFILLMGIYVLIRSSQ